MFLIRMTQLVPQSRFSEYEKTATVSLSGTGTFATVCKVPPQYAHGPGRFVTLQSSRR